MKSARIRLVAWFLCFCTVATVYSAPNFRKADHPASAETSNTIPRFTVVLDAGHGGEDPGAVSGDGIYEKDINLDIAIIVGEMLSVRGYPVVYTRTEDKLLYKEEENIKGRQIYLGCILRTVPYIYIVNVLSKRYTHI